MVGRIAVGQRAPGAIEIALPGSRCHLVEDNEMTAASDPFMTMLPLASDRNRVPP